MGLKKALLTIGVITTLFALTSCATVSYGLYGFKKVKTRTTAQIQKYASRYGIPADHSFVLDTSYLSFLHASSRINKAEAKNHGQPLQALYFDHSGELVSYYINCYATGFPNLKWNKDRLLDTFPPKIQAPLDTLLPFKKQLQFIRTFDNKALESADYSHAEENVVVYWSIYTGRQGKRLIRFIKYNCDMAEGRSINLLFVNTDNAFAMHINKRKTNHL